MPNLPNYLAQAAERAKALGFKPLRIQPSQVDLAYGSLKVEITQNHIVSRFYLQDTVYNKNNYPGLHNHRTPPTVEKIVATLGKIKNNYRRIRNLHAKVLKLGEDIDALIQRMRLHGLVDKSIGRGGIAENLRDHNPINLREVHPIRTINTKAANSAFLTKDVVRSYYRKYLKRLKKTAPREYLEELQRLQSFERKKNTGDAGPINPPVTFTTIMPTKMLYAAAKCEVIDLRIDPKYGPPVNLPITINPTKNDLYRLIKADPNNRLRLLHGLNNNIYVFSSEITHYDVWQALGFRGRLPMAREQVVENLSGKLYFHYNRDDSEDIDTDKYQNKELKFWTQATDSKPATPVEIINQAIAKTRSLRQFRANLVSLARLGGGGYLAMLRLQPKIKTKMLVLDGRVVQTIAKELSHLTHYKFRYLQFVVGKHSAITFGVFIPKSK
jgi:hypothetical protein